MTDHELEQHLRALYRAEIGDRDNAPPALRAELPVLLAASAATRRGLLDGWTAPPVLRFAPLALAAAAVIMIVVVGMGLVARRPNVGPPVGPSSSPTQTQAVFGVALHYYTEIGVLSRLPEKTRIHAVLPYGWEATESTITTESAQARKSVAVSFWAVDAVFIDPCHAEGRADGPLKYSLDGLASAFTGWWQGGLHQPSATEPVRTTVSGFRARYLEVRIPDERDSDDCIGGRYTTWRNADGVERHHQPGDVSRIWIVEVGSPPKPCCPGGPSTPLLVIDATSAGELSPTTLRALDGLIDSIRIEPPREETP